MRLEGADLVSVLAEPKSIAIVGASRKAGSYAHRAMTYLRDYGFTGELHLVNPKYDEIEGLRCVASVADLPPEGVDIAYIAVPAESAASAVSEVAATPTKVAIVIASGIDTAGKQAIAKIAQNGNLRVIGPNCIGAISTGTHAYPSFSALLREGEPRAGRVALVTQSGAMGNAAMVSIQRRGGGIANWFTTGDEVNVGALELANGLLHRSDVDAVGVFFEAMGDLEWLPRLRATIERTGKRVFVVKGAQTAAGRSAAAGHTGRVVGSGEASVAVMREAGIEVLPTMAELADTLVVTDLIGTLPGPRIAVVTVSGGCGVLAADAIVRTPTLELADLKDDPDLTARLGGRVHELANPLDVAGSPTEVFAEWVMAVAARPQVDAVLAIQANIMHDERVLGRELRRPAGGTPIVAVPFAEEDPLSPTVIAELAEHDIAVVPSAERAIAALGRLSRVQVAVAPASTPHVDEGVTGLEEAVDRLGAALPWAPWAIVEDVDAARAFGAACGYPLVLKAAGRVMQHRSENGAVLLGVEQATVDARFAELAGMLAGSGEAILVQRQVASSIELLVSALTDPELGPVVIVRPGGVLAELMTGTAILWGGWTAQQRARTIDESIVGTLLNGYRGGTVLGREPLLCLVEQLLTVLHADRAQFVELNPVLVGPDHVWLVDALVR
jgi:acyl-CoA synthetase (NDP forming)